MNLQQIIEKMDLTLLTQKKDFSEITPSQGYASDLLSCVMSGAPHGSVGHAPGPYKYCCCGCLTRTFCNHHF